MKINKKLKKNIPMYVSFFALAVSFYSVNLSRETHYFNKSQMVTVKTGELFLILQQVSRLRNMETFLVSNILKILNENQEVLDKEKKQSDFYNKRFNSSLEKGEQNFEFFLDLVNDRDNKDIVWLESYLGGYRAELNYLTNVNVRYKKTQDELETKLLQIKKSEQEKVNK